MPNPTQLLRQWYQLGPNAKQILLSIAERMAMGAKRYGDFQHRSWTKEAAEEALDMTVYLSAELVLGSQNDLAGSGSLVYKASRAVPAHQRRSNQMPAKIKSPKAKLATKKTPAKKTTASAKPTTRARRATRTTRARKA